jgi:hypothetical protein
MPGGAARSGPSPMVTVWTSVTGRFISD